MNQGFVSIIGRPNVGKSTLFNRLTGKRYSIIEDSPGVTRDRLYHDVEWQNRHFTLIDTGGITGEEDQISKEVDQQVKFAIESSDLILFLLDGKEGMTAMDQEIARLLHRSAKPCLPVINKIDTHYTPSSAYEFYELGFSDFLIVSAEQGYGIGDLLDKIFEKLPEEKKETQEIDALQTAIIGKPNVGKSSLVNKLLGESRMIVTDIPGTTRDSTDSLYEHKGKQYMLIDTAGLRRKRSVDNAIERYANIRTYRAVDRADLCLFLIDGTVGITEQDSKIAGYAHNEGKASMVVVNKWDIVQKDTYTMQRMQETIRQTLSFMSYAPIVFISVKTGRNLDRLFETMDQVNDNYSFRISTGLLNQLVRQATQLTPPPADKGKRLKIFYAAQVAARPPKIIFYCNDVKLFHFTYMRYLENQIRDHFDFTGVPLILEARERKEK